MCDEFGEVSGIIDLVINFLAGGTLFLNSYDTLSYTNSFVPDDSTFHPLATILQNSVYLKIKRRIQGFTKMADDQTTQRPVGPRVLSVSTDYQWWQLATCDGAQLQLRHNHLGF